MNRNIMIRTQNGKSIVNMQGLSVSIRHLSEVVASSRVWRVYAFDALNDEKEIWLGSYQAEESAIEVLTEIANFINNFHCNIKTAPCVFVMPKDKV